MSDYLMQIYHRMPGPARSLAASLKGLHLRRWRYGAMTDEIVAAALERERWSEAQLKAWREERLARLLHRALTKVPYYREQWAARRRNGDNSSPEYLENWPILEKEQLRQHAKALIATDCNPRRMFQEHTSGTTGKPLILYWSLQTVREWYGLFEARCRNWYGVSRHDRWAILGGQLVTAVMSRRPPFWIWNAGLKQLYMSSYHLSPDLIPYYLDALRRYKIKYLLGFTSSLYELAQVILHTGQRDFDLSVVIANAEPVYDYQRVAIEDAFSCPLRETYGMAEIVTAASECEHRSLHLWTDVGSVELDGEDKNGKLKGTGELIATSLINFDMPLIRYRVGDRLTLSTAGELCTCGRTLPIVTSVDGRTDDLLFTSDGRRIYGADTALATHDLPILEAQIIQDALDRVRLNYIPAAGFMPNHERLLVERLRARMGEVFVIPRPVEKLPRSSNGKYRVMICNLSREEREKLKYH